MQYREVEFSGYVTGRDNIEYYVVYTNNRPMVDSHTVIAYEAGQDEWTENCLQVFI